MPIGNMSVPGSTISFAVSSHATRTPAAMTALASFDRLGAYQAHRRHCPRESSGESRLKEGLLKDALRTYARKGERLIMLTQQKDATRSAFMASARERHASDLMIPSEVVVLDKLPLLGSGKVDMVALTRQVRERVQARAAVVALPHHCWTAIRLLGFAITRARRRCRHRAHNGRRRYTP
jgi:hypothetical protein